MASKAHVQDNSVSERRLRPIYEWLDSGSYKKALQECDKVLKKSPHLQCARALKALSILRMGRDSECVPLLDALVEEGPTEDATLQAMTLCYRELHQPEKICKLYKTAILRDLSNEELHTHLFMSYVRIEDFSMQQRSALDLYKIKPKNPYYCWAVMSVIQQATRGPGKNDPTKRAVLLSLAEKMIHRLISNDMLEAEQEVQLYLMILELQGKFEEALEVYNGPLGTRLVCTTVTAYKLPYLIKLKRWSEVNVVCKTLLIESVDRWNIWKEYINSLFELIKSPETRTNDRTENHTNGENDLESVDDVPEKAHEFICRLVENGTGNSYLLRGPYLARFELCSKMVEHGLDSTDLLGDTIELFIEYFRRFGHKQCCVSDLRIYLGLLDDERKAELSNRLIKDVGISSTSVPQSEQQMQRHICSLQLSRLCGGHRSLSTDHLAALVTAFSLHYQHGQQTYGTNLLSTDQGPSDAYALLAAHILYDLAQSTRSSKPIVTALVLLRSLLKNSPCSFNAKLLCIRLFHTIGASHGAHQMYESLDVKHLQMDSLGYVHCARLPATGLVTLAAALLDATYKFFTANYKDSSDHITFCYKFGSFIKLDDFMDFREKLYNSYHYTLVSVDRIILNVVQAASNDTLYTSNLLPKNNQIDWDNISDNHDLSVYVSWDPERAGGPRETGDQMETLAKQNVQFVTLRSRIPLALSAAAKLHSDRASRNTYIEALKDILKDWRELHARISSTTSVPISQNLLTFPLPSRLHSHLASPYLDVLEPMFRLVLAVATNDDDDACCTAIAADLEKSCGRMVDGTRAIVDRENRADDPCWTRRETMESVVNAVEIICISSVLCLLCQDLARPQQGNKKSKRKADAGAKFGLNEAAAVIRRQMDRLDSCLETWSAPAECDLSDRLALLNLNSDGQNSVFDDIKTSHITAVKELRTVLKCKLKLLNGAGG